MRATEILMSEHRLIEQVLTCLERMAEKCTSEGELDADLARDTVFFLRNYADRCHHGKEEEQLFPMMESRGFSAEQGPTAVMRVEHVQGRAFVGRMDDSIEGAAGGDVGAQQTFASNARGFVALLREHIQKEDTCLFPMSEQVLGDEDRRTLERQFEHVDDNEIGRDLIAQCRRKADALADRFGVPRVT